MRVRFFVVLVLILVFGQIASAQVYKDGGIWNLKKEKCVDSKGTLKFTVCHDDEWWYKSTNIRITYQTGPPQNVTFIDTTRGLKSENDIFILNTGNNSTNEPLTQPWVLARIFVGKGQEPNEKQNPLEIVITARGQNGKEGTAKIKIKLASVKNKK